MSGTEACRQSLGVEEPWGGHYYAAGCGRRISAAGEHVPGPGGGFAISHHLPFLAG